MQELWSAVDRYISETFQDSDDALEAALHATASAGMPEIQIAPNQGRFLQLLAQMAGARSILEVGTLAGYSTIWLARAVPPDGEVATLELEQKHADVARANIARAGLAQRVQIRVGAALDSLRTLVAEKHAPFDFVFIDADKVGYPAYLEWSLRLSKPGTVIVADNIVRNGGVADPSSSDVAVIAVRRYNEKLAADPRLTATVLQTVGSKGYDGFAIARVNA
jgi:predicted O-methyltransferase YrrM